MTLFDSGDGLSSDQLMQRFETHIETCPQHIYDLVGGIPETWETWEELRDRLDELKFVSQWTELEEDREAYIWYMQFLLYLTALALLEMMGEENVDIA